jgi:SAM-dependent MidA family methyltransferase
VHRESLAERLANEIRSRGPISASAFIGAALYDPTDGFYTRSRATGRAGRRGDFLTAPEVGPLFGAVIASAIDAWWIEAGEPAAWVVREVGAGPGTLARSIIAAAPSCLERGALRLELVELSAAQRSIHPTGGVIESFSVSPTGRCDVILANELLDNLPFDIVQRSSNGWREVLVDTEGGAFVEHLGEIVDAGLGADVDPGIQLPIHRDAGGWIRANRSPNCRLVALDYAAPTSGLAARDGGWLRTFREHGAGTHWLDHPGSQDITTDLAVEQIVAAADEPLLTTQAQFLHSHGIAELVQEGRAIWEAGAAAGGLAALKGRSRVREAETLVDPDGMGSFTVFEWLPTEGTSWGA